MRISGALFFLLFRRGLRRRRHLLRSRRLARLLLRHGAEARADAHGELALHVGVQVIASPLEGLRPDAVAGQGQRAPRPPARSCRHGRGGGGSGTPPWRSRVRSAPMTCSAGRRCLRHYRLSHQELMPRGDYWGCSPMILV